MVYIQIHKTRNIDENTDAYSVINIITEVNLAQNYDGVLAKPAGKQPELGSTIDINDKNIIIGIKVCKKEELEFKVNQLNNPKTLNDWLVFNLLKANKYNTDAGSIVNSISEKIDSMNFEQLYDSSVVKLIADEVVQFIM
jgi:hypothetical protein